MPGAKALHILHGLRELYTVGYDVVEVAPGQVIWCEPGARVRYGNPFAEECEYYALCLPAFSPDTVHREEE